MNDEIDEFYMLKKNYMNKKTNRCINCNRAVGTEFKIEYFSVGQMPESIYGQNTHPTWKVSRKLSIN